MTEPILELSHVFCVHRSGHGDVAALQGLELRLDRGEVLAVLGPSGAGKSTLLRVIAGVQIPSAGVVSLLGRDIGRLPARERLRLRNAQIGFVGQRLDGAVPDAIPLRRVVELPLALRGVPRGERRRRAEELLAAVALSDRAGARTSELSGGERQRVALCAALAHRPALLLADEPSGELDAASAAMIRDLITSLSREFGSSAVIASHDEAMAAAADRVLVVRDGRVVEERRDGASTAVLGRGGWLPLPPDLVAQAQIGTTARVRAVDRGLIVEPAGERTAGVVTAGDAPATSPAEGRGAAVEARSLSRSRGRGRARRLVLDGFVHAFAAGAMTVVTGRSGSGKTTLLRLLAGLERPDAGDVLIDGRSLDGSGAEELAALRRTRVAFMPQEPAPAAFLSPTENIVLALQLRGLARPAALERACAALAHAGLSERARQPAERLSAGEAQRLGLARALACSSGLLVLDEPTSRLDRLAAAAVAERLAAAAIDGHTVICATHDPSVIELAAHVVELPR